MTYKYLKLILFLTISIQAAPKVFNSLGSDLELFQQENCKIYKKITSLPEKIKKECRTFDTKVNNAFKVGYKLDPYIDSEISEKKLNRYLSLLRDLDKRKDNILTFVYSEAKKAREKNNTKYYSQLIENDKLRLYSSDYEFMKKNKDIFIHNNRFVNHLKHLEYLKELKKEEVKEVKRVAPKKNSKLGYQQPMLKTSDTLISPNSSKCYKVLDDSLYYVKKTTRKLNNSDYSSALFYSKRSLEACSKVVPYCRGIISSKIMTVTKGMCTEAKNVHHKIKEFSILSKHLK